MLGPAGALSGALSKMQAFSLFIWQSMGAAATVFKETVSQCGELKCGRSNFGSKQLQPVFKIPDRTMKTLQAQGRAERITVASPPSRS